MMKDDPVPAGTIEHSGIVHRFRLLFRVFRWGGVIRGISVPSFVP